jgi:hypothetical protein
MEIEGFGHKKRTYEIPIPYHSRDMINDISFFLKVGQTSRSGGHKIIGTYRKVLSQRTHMKYKIPITYNLRNMNNASF